MKKIVAASGSILVMLAVLAGPARGDEVVYSPGPSVVLGGLPVVGSTVSVATPGQWSPEPDSRTYEWLRDGEGAVLSTSTSYPVTAADVGHTLVLVERVSFGQQQDDSSATTQPVEPGLAVPKVVVAGARGVGKALRATVTGTSLDTSTSLRWLRDGAPIPGANGTTYTTVTADAGRAVTAQATSSRPDYPAVTGRSAALAEPAVNAKRPTITGTSKVGKRLSLRSKGTWYAPSHRYTYQWLRNGSSIKGATRSTYKLSKKDRRKRITVRVSVRRSGFPTVAATSSRTSRVR